jgi:hypothetical protein
MGIDKTILNYSVAVAATEKTVSNHVEVAKRAKRVFLDTTTSLWDALLVWLGFYDSKFEQMSGDAYLIPDNAMQEKLKQATQVKLFEIQEGCLVTRWVLSKTAIDLWDQTFAGIEQLKEKQAREIGEFASKARDTMNGEISMLSQDPQASFPPILNPTGRRITSFLPTQIKIGGKDWVVPSFYKEDHARFPSTYVVRSDGGCTLFLEGCEDDRDEIATADALHSEICFLAKEESESDNLTKVLYLMTAQRASDPFITPIVSQQNDRFTERNLPYAFSPRDRIQIIRQSAGKIEITNEFCPALRHTTSAGTAPLPAKPISFTYHLENHAGRWRIMSVEHRVHDDASTLPSAQIKAQGHTTFQPPASK